MSKPAKLCRSFNLVAQNLQLESQKHPFGPSVMEERQGGGEGKTETERKGMRMSEGLCYGVAWLLLNPGIRTFCLFAF